MEKNYPNLFLFIVVLLNLCFGAPSVYAQRDYAEAINSENQVDLSSQAIDNNLLTSAGVRANSGLALGIGSYAGHLELQFDDEIPAFKTSYIRLDTDDDLLPFLLGGTLGELLANVVGAVLLGNQEFSVEVKNNNTSILNNDSAFNNAFATNAMRVVTDSSGDYFIASSPNAAYNRIRITNRVGSLIGLSTEKVLDVYGAFTSSATANACLNAEFTSFDGTGITLDLLELGDTGVNNPEFAIDNDANTYSELGFGIVNAAASLSQTFYFDNVSAADDVFYVTLGVDPSLLQLGVLNNIDVIASNGTSTNTIENELSSLLDLDLLGLLTENGTVDIPISPGMPIDRLTVTLNSLLGVGLDERIKIFDVRRAPAEPGLDPSSENLAICAGSTANLIATTADEVEEELLWYDVDGNLVAVLDSGVAFSTNTLSDTTTFYVAAREKGCDDESSRKAVEVVIVPIPTAADIDIEKTNDGSCGTGEVTVSPSSTINGSYKWYFNQEGTNEIVNNSVVEGITYTIAPNGNLMINGLQNSFDSYNVYAKLIEETASCENAPGDLKEVSITAADLELEANLLLDSVVSIAELLNLSSTSEITVNSQEISICSGTSLDLLATVQNETDLEVRWYDALTDGNLLATLDSGASFDTGILTEDTTLYVAVGRIGCLLETAKATISINVLDRPTAADIDVFGADDPLCGSGDVVLVPSSEMTGTFEWYLDENKTSPITDGMVSGSVTYSVSETGTLMISGLDHVNAPYNYYVGLAREVADCNNEDGELKEVTVSVVDSDFDFNAVLQTIISLDDVLRINNENASIALEGSVSGDVANGDNLMLQVNGKEYPGSLDANLEYSVEVDGMDVLLDPDQHVELSMMSTSCSTAKQLALQIPELPLIDTNQVFCASDNPTILDLELSTEDGVLFNALVGGQVLGMNEPLVDEGVYYAGLLNLPVSVFARIEIRVTIIEVDPPTTNDESQTFCELDNPIIGDLQVDQNDVIFYDSAENGTMLDPSDPLTNGTYYVSRVENGCESVDRLLITVTIEEDEPITLNGQITEACVSRSYTYTTVGNQTNYIWTVTGGVITEGGSNTDDYVTITWAELQNTSVEVSYVSTGSCTATKELVQDVETVSCGEVLGAEFCLEVFNEFSPNADGFNDFFEIECITDYDNTIQVYNRNGNLVFETQNYQNDWNGVANVNGVLGAGKPLPAGTYYYVVNIPELERDLVGWLQLAR